MTSATAAPPASSELVSLEDVEQALAQRVKALQAPGEAPVLHARMSNLLIYCDGPEQAAAASAEIPAVVAVHPARVLLLVADAQSKTNELTAQVSVVTHPAGAGRRVFCDQVTLSATGARVQRLPFAVRPLLIGDLPVNLWWVPSQPPPLGGVLFHDLAESVEHVVYDSIGWPDPARGVVAVGTWVGQLQRRARTGHWCVASDLNWRRIKFWRRIVSQALDPALVPGLLDGITEVTLTHGPHAVVQGWLVLSWLAGRLGWRVQSGRVRPGVAIDWQLEGPHGPVQVRLRREEEGPPRIRALHVRATVGGESHGLHFLPEEDSRLAVVPEGEGVQPRTVTVPPLPLAELVGRQLTDRERDRAFCDSMAVAKALAESVIE
jgi:glucose-6-phosphate dehydrogenase assembly protein OpcA